MIGARSMEVTATIDGCTRYDVEERTIEYVVPSDPMDDLQCDSCQ